MGLGCLGIVNNMQLVIKGIKGDTDTVDVPDGSTVIDLKAIIMSQLNHPVTSQKLLFKGKILDNNKLLSDYGVKHGDAVVIMVQKVPEVNLFEQNVQELIKIGIDRHEAETILKNFNNDLEKAKEYIINSLDMNEEDDSEENEADLLSRGSTTFNFLLNSPEFQSIRTILRQDPNELEPLMSQLSTSNPELFNLIKSNLDEFLAVIGLRRSPEEQVEISQSEQSDVKELCELGFDEDDVLEAYLACDKNKELAASYLFENFQQRFD